MIFRINPKRKVINRANRLIKFLYNFQVNQVRKKQLTSDEQFAVLSYEQKVRELTEELIDKLKLS